MTSGIFQFLLDFALVLGELSSNLWSALQEQVLGVPIWALLGSTLIIGSLFVNIIKAIVGG